MARLDGKVAMVTGAARGLGAEAARELAAAGARVVLTDVDDKEGRATTETIVAAGGTAAVLVHDVPEEPAWAEAVAFAQSTFGGLHILVNNAGIEITKFIEETTVEDLKRISTINEIGVFLGIKHAIGAMKEGGGSIINLSSVAGLAGAPGLAAYCMTKGGVRLLTKAAALECAKLGYAIRVNSVHPGLIDTEMSERLLQRIVDMGLAPDMDAAEQARRLSCPVGRLGTPREVGAAVLFLASDAASYLTGSELVIDGGYTAQ